MSRLTTKNWVQMLDFNITAALNVKVLWYIPRFIIVFVNRKQSEIQGLLKKKECDNEGRIGTLYYSKYFYIFIFTFFCILSVITCDCFVFELWECIKFEGVLNSIGSPNIERPTMHNVSPFFLHHGFKGRRSRDSPASETVSTKWNRRVSLLLSLSRPDGSSKYHWKNFRRATDVTRVS